MFMKTMHLFIYHFKSKCFATADRGERTSQHVSYVYRVLHYNDQVWLKIHYAQVDTSNTALFYFLVVEIYLMQKKEKSNSIKSRVHTSATVPKWL